jgi:hypothetical protein
MYLGALTACRARPDDLRAEVVDVSLEVLADGSALVRETISLQVGATPVARFERRVSGERVDDFIDISTSMDGVRLSEGEREGTVQIRRSGDLRVLWRFRETSGRRHTFIVAYRAIGVIGVAGLRGTLRWPVLEQGRPYAVASARVALTLPKNSAFLGSPAMGAPGAWRTTAQAAQFSADRDGVDIFDDALLTAEMTMESLGVAEPRWQIMAARARDLVPAFVAAGLFIIVTGLGIVWIIRFQHPRVKPAVDAEIPQSAPAAMRMAVLHGRRIRGVPEMLAAVLDLMVRSGAGPPLLAHERIVVEELLPQTQGKALGGTHAWSGVLPRDLRRRFRRALAADLGSAGLVDADRLNVAIGLRRAGYAVLALGVVSSVVVPRVLGELGIWPMAVPASVVIVAGLLFATGGAFRILTGAGERAAVEWRQ